MFLAPSPSAELGWPDATTTVTPAKPKKKTENNGYYHGTVTQLSERSLTIQGSGMQGVGPPNIIAGLRRFAASEWVAPGGIPADRFTNKGEMPYRPVAPDDYCLHHARVGDRVDVKYMRVRGVDVCISLRIERRPGGQVPQSPSEQRGTGRMHHETVNALQKFEERGEAPPPDFWGRCPDPALPDPPPPPPPPLAPPPLGKPPKRGKPLEPLTQPAGRAAPPAVVP